MADLDIIVKMIIYKSREVGNPVTEPLAAYVAKTIINPKGGQFYLENTPSEDEGKELVEKAFK